MTRHAYPTPPRPSGQCTEERSDCLSDDYISTRVLADMGIDPSDVSGLQILYSHDASEIVASDDLLDRLGQGRWQP